MSIQAPAPKQHEPSPLSHEHEPALGIASQGVLRLGALQDLVDRSPRMLAQRQVVQGVHQRRIDYVGASLESRPRHADVKPRVRAAFQRIKTRLAKEDQQAFESAFGEDPDNLSLGHRLIELAHDATEHGEVDLDNDQHVMALFHEVMALERHSLDAYDFSTELAKEFGRLGSVALSAPDLSPPVNPGEHTQLVKAVGGAFNEMWVRDAVRSVGLRPQGKSETARGGDTPVALDNLEHLKKVYTALVRKQRESSTKDGPGASATWRERIWDTVYLGAGPAVAYHMVANRLGSDPLQTLVIGRVQPWEPGSRNDRAFKSVNHPLGWISPKRGRADDPESFADTGDFSVEVAQVLKAHSVLQIDTDIRSGGVRKAEAGQAYYEVETGRGTFRARHLVSALGIGKHKPPLDAADFESRQASGGNVRVLDMDEFHRQLGKPDSELNRVRSQRGADFSIVLAGPNAGVDVAYSATKADIKVTWFAASQPAWVEGFANFKIRTSNLTVVLAYFGDYQRRTGVGVTEGVTVTAGKDRYTEKVADILTQAGVQRVLKASDAPDSTFDYLVYAVGPDESASGALDAGLKAALENKDADIPDADHRFTQPASIGGTEEQQRTREEVQLAAGPVKEKLEAALERWYGRERIEREPEVVAKAIEAIAVALDGLEPLAALQPSATLNLRLRGDDGTSLEVIGAQAARVTGKEKAMAPVISSLGPTVVGNDQLTPSRSRAEASAGVLPAYLGKATGGVDLATDDQVAIAAFVAMAFDLPPLLADYVTRRIIEDRVGTAPKATLGDSTGLRPKDGDPASFGRAFREKWIALLKQLEALTQ
ncbi:hypothetical protein OU995_04675 [Roseateles sp. SL47]|uniref:hypothetical protein n=1 Tax=Roseateles sp. SL47 TaxID=2995138 RepID=UPI00226EBB95|nr:hypothetical protein [Roseateles sp. SL47]WAC74030.1 hypothetical protein OU995_04675 [Roseateles sp. SL47]